MTDEKPSEEKKCVECDAAMLSTREARVKAIETLEGVAYNEGYAAGQKDIRLSAASCASSHNSVCKSFALASALSALDVVEKELAKWLMEKSGKEMTEEEQQLCFNSLTTTSDWEIYYAKEAKEALARARLEVKKKYEEGK